MTNFLHNIWKLFILWIDCILIGRTWYWNEVWKYIYIYFSESSPNQKKFLRNFAIFFRIKLIFFREYFVWKINFMFFMDITVKISSDYTKKKFHRRTYWEENLSAVKVSVTSGIENWTRRSSFWSELFRVSWDILCGTSKFGVNMMTKIMIIWLIGAALSVSKCLKIFDTFVKNIDFCWHTRDVRCYWQLAEVYLFKI